jgi:hypothetical protein
MNIFIDTNILLDVLAKREPFYTASAEIWSLAERGEVQGFISAIRNTSKTRPPNNLHAPAPHTYPYQHDECR